MSLFDKVFKGKLKDIEKIANQVQNIIEDTRKSEPEQNVPEEQTRVADSVSTFDGESGSAFLVDKSNTVAQVKPVFDSIIEKHFASCDVKRDYAASNLDASAHPACAPVQYMFFKNGSPCLAVVLVKTNNYKGMNVIATKKICEDKGIKYIRFFAEYPNEEDYVVNRIKENLN